MSKEMTYLPLSGGRDEDDPPRRIPHRRVPTECPGSRLGHYWLVDSIEIALAFPDFFERHRQQGGAVVWVVCAHCGYPRMVAPDLAPPSGRVRLCVDCYAALPYRTNNNGMQIRCASCGRAHRNRLQAEYRRAWKARNIEMVRASDRRYKERKRSAGKTQDEEAA